MYAGVRGIFGRYWGCYGGMAALLSSFYLHAAFLILLLTFRFWSADKWWEQSLAVLPNLLGFSLGGFAMFLGFGDEKFRGLLADSSGSGRPSAYLSLCSSFVHFIVVQFLALLAAIVGCSIKYTPSGTSQIDGMLSRAFISYSGFGYLLFLYSLTSLLGATMAVFRMASIYDAHNRYLASRPEAGEGHPR